MELAFVRSMDTAFKVTEEETINGHRYRVGICGNLFFSQWCRKQGHLLKIRIVKTGSFQEMRVCEIIVKEWME